MLLFHLVLDSRLLLSDHDILKFQCVLDWIRLPQIYKESTCLSSWWFFTSWRMSVKSSMCDLLYLGRQTWNLQHRSHVADCIPNTSNQMVHQNLGSMAGNELAGLANGQGIENLSHQSGRWIFKQALPCSISFVAWPALIKCQGAINMSIFRMPIRISDASDLKTQP